MKYLDLFSGIGGFTLALKNATNHFSHKQKRECSPAQDSVLLEGGCEPQLPSCIGYSEIDKYASAIYKKHYHDHNELGDITKIDTAKLPDFDLLMGGFPCQSFSIAGKRGGFDDTRGTLFFEIARILRDKTPKYFLLENVKGLLSHDSGRTFSTIIETLQEIGYGVSWKVLNTKDFGIPQNRERVFIFGVRGECPREILPLGKGDGLSDTEQVEGAPSISALTATDYKGASKQRPNLVVPVLTPDRAEKRQNGRRFKEDGDPSFTLTAQDKHGVYNGSKIRRLTPTECERLQGFPDGWTTEGNYDGEIKEVSNTQKYKCLGNAVTVKVVEEVLKSVLNIDKKKTPITSMVVKSLEEKGKDWKNILK